MHPANLALRFLLELAALCGFGVLAWNSTHGIWRFVAVFLALAVAMSLWGTFAVPNDPSRSGAAPVPVPGVVRLVLELVILLGGAAAFYLAGLNTAALLMAALTILHYALAGDRIRWLLQQ